MVFHGEGISQILYFVLFIGFIFLYPKLMLSSLVGKIQKEIKVFEDLTESAVKTTAKGMNKPMKEVVPKIKRFMEFFAVPPIDMDPAGIVQKLDKVIRESRDSFSYFIKTNSGVKDPVMLRNLEGAVMHTSATHEIEKIMKHFLGIVKKYKNFQIAMIINMQIPMIKELAKSLKRSVEAFVNQEPVGDGVGPLVITELAGSKKLNQLKGTEMVYVTTKINGRNCILTKADGPGSTVGYPGTGMVQLIKRYKPVRIITIDAKSKLEGEKTGSLAEGVGVAMGGPGTDRYEIEEIAYKNNIPIDAIGIKMSQEEAICWMPGSVAKAVPGAIGYVKEKLERVPINKNVLIIGVGNTVGVGNSKKELEDTYKKIKKNSNKLKKLNEEEKQKKGFFKK